MNTFIFKTKEEMESKIETMKEVTKEFGTEVNFDLAKLKGISKILEDDFSEENIVKVLKEFDNHESIMIEMVRCASFVDGVNFIKEKETPNEEDILSELMLNALKISVFTEAMHNLSKILETLDRNNPRYIIELVKARLDAIHLNIKANQIKGYSDGIHWVVNKGNDEIDQLLKSL